MRFYIDTEYDWNSREGQIRPISIGIVAEDGREFYGIVTDYEAHRLSPFVEGVVLPNLCAVSDCAPFWGRREAVAERIKTFIGRDHPEFWGDYSGFDYVVLSMLMGGFEDWPEGWPMHINDMQQDAIPSIQAALPHHALSDARAVRDAWEWAFAKHPAKDAA